MADESLLTKPTKVSTMDDGLTVYTYYLECLAHGSYVVAHEGNCFVVDPTPTMASPNQRCPTHVFPPFSN